MKLVRYRAYNVTTSTITDTTRTKNTTTRYTTKIRTITLVDEGTTRIVTSEWWFKLRLDKRLRLCHNYGATVNGVRYHIVRWTK